jgi:hypothetical protein
MAALPTAADKMAYSTAADTWAETAITAAGRAVLDDADAAAQRTTLGVAIGTDVQAYDSDLAAVAALAGTGLVAHTAAGAMTERTITGTADEIAVANGDGIAGNPTLSLTGDGARGKIMRAAVEIPGGTGAGKVGSLNGTPVQVIAAPGAGKYIEIVSFAAWLAYASAAYDGVAGGENLGLYYSGGGLCSQEVPGVGFGDGGSDQHRIANGADVATPLAATAVVAKIAVGEWYAAAGNSPLKLEIFYRERVLDFTV